MKKFLFNINSTSWFYRNRKGKVGKIEMALTIGCLSAWLIAIVIGHQGALGNINQWTLYSALPFILFCVQFPIFGAFLSPVSREIEDAFWKTQMWRMLDIDYSFQKELYPNAEERILELRDKWEAEYGMTPEETILNAPFAQNKFVVVYTFFGGIILLTVLSYLITGYFA